MAKRTEVLLVKDVLKLGNMGDLVKVAPGYARNYLYPYGMAIPAGYAAKRQIEVLREKAAKSEAEREAKAKVTAKSMQAMVIQIPARVAHEDELFGSIGAKEIVQSLDKKGIRIDSKQVHLHDKLRRLGRFPVEIRLHKNVPVEITVEIVNSDPNAPSLDDTLKALAAQRAEAKAAREAAAASKGAAGAEGAEDAAKDGKDAKDGKKPAEKAAEAKADKAEKAESKPGKGGKAEKAEKSAKPEKAEKAEAAGGKKDKKG